MSSQHVEGRPLFIGALQDVTESKLAEEALSKARSELAHVSRVMTLGALTASIAHEVNQPLSGIITNASTCLRMLARRSTQPRRRPCDDAAHAARRQPRLRGDQAASDLFAASSRITSPSI